ncbi:MAG TPA: hypothetical protein VKZ63_08655 [Kofleriaceae bacterium]|nr:hypothetical protein [Kofleriaceae bacterium]
MDSTRPRSRQDSVQRRRLEARRAAAPVQPLAGAISGSSGWGGPGTYRLNRPAGGRDVLRPAVPRRRIAQGSAPHAALRRVAPGSAVVPSPASSAPRAGSAPPEREREPTLRTAAPLWTAPPAAAAKARPRAAATLLPIALASLVAIALVAIALIAR